MEGLRVSASAPQARTSTCNPSISFLRHKEQLHFMFHCNGCLTVSALFSSQSGKNQVFAERAWQNTHSSQGSNLLEGRKGG